MMEDVKLAQWLRRIQEADNEIMNKQQVWQSLRRLWRGILPPGSDRVRQFQAKTFVHIIQPRVLAFTAKEMMYVFGSPKSLTVSIAGKRNNKKLEVLEDRTQTVFDFLLSDARRFIPHANATQDKHIYGNCGIKSLPLLDSDDPEERDKIFKDEVILPWMFLFDADVNNFYDSPWAGHDVVLSRNYLESKPYYDKEAIKKLSETRNPFSEKLGLRDDERGSGILVTEIWDKTTGRMFTIGNRSTVIREPMDFPYDVFPYVWGQAYGESNLPYGFGIADTLKWIAFYCTYLRNQRMNNIMKGVNNILVVPKNNINLDDLKNPRPGGFIRVDSMDYAPKQLQAVDVTRTIEEEIMIQESAADKNIGLSAYAQGQMPSKRTVTPEVMAAQQGSGQFWYLMKLAEAHQYAPLGKIWLQYLSHAPDNYFDRMVSPIDAVNDPEKYEEIGPLAPKDIRKYKTQITPMISANVMNDEEIRRQVAEFVNLIGSVAPEYLNIGEVFSKLQSTYRQVSGMKNLLKTDEEIKKQKEEFMNQLSQRILSMQQGIQGWQGGGGSIASPALRGEG
jgi:hypothetical protein